MFFCKILQCKVNDWLVGVLHAKRKLENLSVVIWIFHNLISSGRKFHGKIDEHRGMRFFCNGKGAVEPAANISRLFREADRHAQAVYIVS